MARDYVTCQFTFWEVYSNHQNGNTARERLCRQGKGSPPPPRCRKNSLHLNTFMHMWWLRTVSYLSTFCNVCGLFCSMKTFRLGENCIHNSRPTHMANSGTYRQSMLSVRYCPPNEGLQYWVSTVGCLSQGWYQIQAQVFEGSIHHNQNGILSTMLWYQKLTHTSAIHPQRLCHCLLHNTEWAI